MSTTKKKSRSKKQGGAGKGPNAGAASGRGTPVQFTKESADLQRILQGQLRALGETMQAIGTRERWQSGNYALNRNGRGCMSGVTGPHTFPIRAEKAGAARQS
jgi:hypothetical protein